MKKVLNVLAATAFLIAIVNFAWFFGESSRLGGDAQNGYEQDGHYYVESHGVSTEVSQAEWQWSKLHVQSLCITHPLGMLGMAYLLFGTVFPGLLARSSRETINRVVSEIEASGASLITFSGNGKIGLINFNGPILRTTVYPLGVIFKPVLLKPYALKATQISSVTAQTGIFSYGIQINHTSSEVANPIMLSAGAENGDALAALQWIKTNAQR